MLVHFPLVFSSPRSLQLALGIVVLTVIVGVVRKLGTACRPRLLVVIGAICLAIAAGQPIWNRPRDGQIAVMVDLSPSTRGATFRNRAALEIRIHQLIGNHPYQAIAFSDRNQPLPLGNSLLDVPADQTRFTPPASDAILLFSDGQFPLPANAPPTYPVIDPTLNHPPDSAVTDLKSIGNHVLAEVKNEDPTNLLDWTGAVPDKNQPLLATPKEGNEITAYFITSKDRWPENDFLAINLPPPDATQNWWVGPSPPAGWRSFSADTLPYDIANFLEPSVIALNNISADDLSTAQQQRLQEYVHDLGGALLIVGGDHAFAAGHYDGSVLENLSPLSSSPPLPTQKWLLLIDGSGSMAGDPWQTEIDAISRIIPQLPPRDAVTAGSFAKSLSLWPTTTVPSNIFPTGPTNLAPTLQQIISTSDGSSPTQLLLITDAQTELPNPELLTAGLKQKKIHLHLLAIGTGSALPSLKKIASLTDGLVLEQPEPRQWIDSTKQLLRSALPDHFQHTTVALTPTPPAAVSDWNLTWLKPAATAIQQSPIAPMTARWQMGLGQVIAMAYPADPTIAVSYAKQIANPPHDPRFKVTWDAGASLRITIDAVDGDKYLNGELIFVEINGIKTPMPQIAPGEYEIALPSQSMSRIVTVRNQNQVLKRFAVAGRYPAEFDGIGNDLVNLKKLADRSGGSVISPGPVHPIEFNWPARQTPVTSEFAFAGFAMISAGMIWNKRSRN